jgi:succinate dehydrogenase/fumarate reductase flavoprotein subunit
MCPHGVVPLLGLVGERLDDSLTWLESLGAPVVERDTGNPHTVGVRFDPRGLTDALVRASGDLRLETPLPDDAGVPIVLATGGFQGASELVRRFIRPGGDLLLRANAWSAGDGLAFAVERGAALSAGLAEFYGRAMPAPPARVGEDDFVRLAQLYGRHALVLDESGAELGIEEVSWSETDLVQAIARRPNARAWYVVDDPALDVRVRGRSVRELVEAARDAGGTAILAGELPFELPGSYRYAVHVQAAITHTIGGLRVDERSHVLAEDGAPVEGLYAAGVDAGGVSTGGYASGLAAALVLGLAAAEEATR